MNDIVTRLRDYHADFNKTDAWEAAAEIKVLRARVAGLEAERDELKARASRIFDAHQAALAERDRLQADLARANARASAYKLVADEYDAIRSESRGVAGYHLNGDIATWDEFEVDFMMAAARRLEGE